MKSNNNINKLKIIKMFLENKKTLKEISYEENIPYSTLKRWIKKFRDDGIEALNLKERSDKNSFRKVDNTLLATIRNFYLENKNNSLQTIYNDLKNNFNSNISFNTFYRIISNLDEYLKNKSSTEINKNIKNGDVYILKSFISYNFIEINNTKKLPIIFLIFNASDLDIIDFHIEFSLTNSQSILAFLRESIILGLLKYNVTYLPKEILNDSSFKLSNNIKKQINDSLSLKIHDFIHENKEIERFINFLNSDIEKNLKNNITYENLYDFLSNYLKVNKSLPTFIESEDNNLLMLLFKLNIFLPKIKRKIHSYGIQIHNTIFNDRTYLKRYLGEVAEIIYNPLNLDFILAFKKNYLIGKIKNDNLK